MSRGGSSKRPQGYKQRIAMLLRGVAVASKGNVLTLRNTRFTPRNLQPLYNPHFPYKSFKIRKNSDVVNILSAT